MELLKKAGQTFHMLKQGVALTQAQGTGGHIQQAPDILPRGSVKYGHRGGVIAGVQAQTAQSGHAWGASASSPAAGSASKMSSD